MRKLLLTCECGEQMRIPRSALGRTGLCPACGRALRISADNTVTTNGKGLSSAAPSMTPGPRTAPAAAPNWPADPKDDAQRQFGQAVDLYFAGKFAEALAILNALARQYPDNEEVQSGRDQCLAALESRSRLALEHKKFEDKNGHGDLTADSVKQFVLHKMMNAASEDVQLKAAELACRILGMLPVEAHDNGSIDHAHPADRPTRNGANAARESVILTPGNGNSH